MKNQKKKNKKERDPLAGDMSYLFDRDDGIRVQFEFKKKDKTITLRLSEDLLNEVKAKAEAEGIDYQKWIRHAMERSLGRGA